MKRVSLILLLWTVFSVVCLIQSITAQERPMTLVFWNDYAPFSYTENEKNNGILVDILTEVLSKRMKITIEIQMGPWARMQELVKTGKADAICTNPTNERKEYAVPSKVSTLSFYYKIYTNKNLPKLNILKKVANMQELREQIKLNNFIIGATIGDGWGKTNLEDHNIKIDYSPSLESNLRKLGTLRVDAFVNNEIVQEYNIKNLLNKYKNEGNADAVKEISNVIKLDAVMDNAHFYLLIGKQSPYLKYLGEFEKVMAQVQKEGIVDQFLKKYR